MKSDRIKVIEEIFQIHKVLTISEISELLDCSDVTARRRLKEAGYFSSYTHNSQYYTIESVAKFNQNGIWCHVYICFSKQFTLKQTIIDLIDNSRHGMTVRQISEIMLIKCYSPLNLFYKNGIFNRIRYDNKYIYLSTKQKIYERQLDYYKRLERLSPQVAIELLVEYINNPNLTYKEISQAMNKKNLPITVEAIRLFFKEHGVKKMPKF